MNEEYIEWIQELKHRISSFQIKAGLAVNAEMITLYWSIGKDIADKQELLGWGSKIVEQMSKDLKRELPDTNGFSRTNLFAMKQFYLFYNDSEFIHQVGGLIQNGTNPEINQIVHQVGGQLSKNNIKVEYALQDMNKPMGISEFSFNELPQNLQRNLPTVQELENELKKLNNE